MNDEVVPADRLRLITFGGLSIQSETGAQLSGAATRRQSLALLAFLAAGGGSGGVSRDRLCAVFWPESDTDRARNALKQTIFSMRRDLKQPELVTGTTEIRLNREVICSDVGDFASALAARDFDRAARLCTGSFLEGVHLRNAPEFERWAEHERSRLSEQADMAMRAAARAATARGDHELGVIWWRRVVALHPLDAGATMELMQTLALRGDRAAALQQAKLHSAYVLEELGTDADPRIAVLVKQLSSLHTTSSPDVRTRRDADAATSKNGVTEHVAAPVTAAATPRLPEAREIPAKKTRPSRILAAIVVGTLIGAAWIGWANNLKAKAAPAPAGSAVFIAPFHVDAADSSLAFLHEGMVDLLSSTLAGDTLGPRVVDPASVLAVFRNSRSGQAGDPSLQDVLEQAKRAGAERVVSGSVVRTNGDVFLTATMMNVVTGRPLGKADASGDLDNLPKLVDQLAAQLIAIQMGERAVTSELLSGTSLSAVKSYLVGRVAFRRGAYEEAVLHYKRALLTDSTFSLAAVELGRIAGWLGDDAARRWAYERAWANREKLRPLDRAVVRAMLGPNYPKGSTRAEWLAAWEHVAEVRPEEPEGWYEAGDLLFHNPWLGTASDREGLARAAAFFSRALDRAPDYVPALQHLLQLAAHNQDTATVRRVLAATRKLKPSPELETFLRWRSALALGELAIVKEMWARFQPANVLALQWVAMTSQEDGIALDEAAQALQVRLQRASTDQERVDAFLALHALALNRGELRAATRVLETLEATRLGTAQARDIRVLDVIYGGVPLDAAAIDAVGQMEAAPYPAVSTTVATREQWSIDRCILGHWYLARGENTKVSRAASSLQNLAASFSRELWSDGAATCALLLDTFVAVKDKKPSADPMLRNLDKTLSSGAYVTSRLVWDITVIASGRLFELAGDLPRAKSAARRRNWFYRWPHYLATQLDDLGRIAARQGDKATARDAYGHYLLLRNKPDSALKQRVEEVRVAYGSLLK